VSRKNCNYYKRNKGNIFIDVRNELTELKQNKKYYPEFVKRSKTIQNRDELLFLADEIIQKARKENLVSLNRAKQLALKAVEEQETILSPEQEIGSDKIFPLEKKSTSVSTGTESTSDDIERESIANDDNNSLCMKKSLSCF